MATTLFWDGAHAKAGDNPRTAWENSNGNPFTIAISPRKAALTPKPATGLGKIEAEPVYHGDRETKRDSIDETLRIDERIRIKETIRDEPCRRID